MTQSMTGFSRAIVATDSVSVTIEMRSVNNRYLDVQIRCPDILRSQEAAWRQKIAKHITRGKVDVTVRTDLSQHSGSLQLDRGRLEELQTVLTQLATQFPNAPAPDQLALLMTPGVIAGNTIEESVWLEAGTDALNQALNELVDSRKEEGRKLESLIVKRCEAFKQYLADYRGALPQLQEIHRQRLLDRIQQLSAQPDAKRLEEELVYSAQKTDVDEELDRLDAHLAAIEVALAGKLPCGRRLDFLMQELNREANTLASKSAALTTTQTAVEFKVIIEQMREQIQNIE
ncbi:YicC/YloC family endoribonuclease [Luminiphilus sp. nBUS_16]|uniref:YicC/YloC family endoribonuclease n=1 Tax=Luminiphilus sp. nBUS_16 TaxID=3395315 RepID=UPI003EBA08A5